MENRYKCENGNASRFYESGKVTFLPRTRLSYNPTFLFFLLFSYRLSKRRLSYKCDGDCLEKFFATVNRFKE